MSTPQDDPMNWSILLQGIRQGDKEAERLFVERYKDLLYKTVPVHGVNRDLQRHLESGDLVLSTLWNALRALREGEVDFTQESDLVGWLRTLALNERNRQARHFHRGKRDSRKTVNGEEGELERQPAQDQTPSQIVSQKEQLQRIEEAANTDDLKVLKQRAEDVEWQQLADARHTTAEALRKRIERVRKTLREILEDPESEEKK